MTKKSLKYFFLKILLTIGYFTGIIVCSFQEIVYIGGNIMAGNLVSCKACGKEIAKGVKKCPNCGKDQRNFL
ncbi:hypothetical protein QNN00_04875 [Bacillus velezensis]|nr:hypothetical protein [Bacillus velezensis]